MAHNGPGTCQLIRQAKTATEVELLRWEGKNTKTEASEVTRRRWERLADRRLKEIELAKIAEELKQIELAKVVKEIKLKAAETKTKKETKP